MDQGGPSLDEASALLDRLLVAAKAGQRKGAAVEILALRAVAHDRRGEGSAASAALAGALECGAREGYVRVFVDEVPPAAALLGRVALDGLAAAHARRVIAAANPAEQQSAVPPSNGDAQELSDRELDVLRLLRGDVSGPEIARELTVSLNTMRTHTKNIYAKLGVTNRREAVSRAAALGL